MAARYHYKQKQKIKLIVYTDRDQFLAGSPSKNAAGYAIPSENLIAVLDGQGDPAGFQTTLAHEINHIIFIRSVPIIASVPQWFIEGLAIYESHPGIKVARLEKYALAQDLPDVISLRPDPGPAELKDYAQGYLLVGFIVSEYGRDALDNVIARMQMGDDFNSAMLQTLKVTPQELNDRSKTYMNTQLIYVWLYELQDLGWYFACALFIVAGTVAFVRKRRHLAGINDEEYGNDDGNPPWDDDDFTGFDFGDGAKV
jgi:hypothetical protein